MIMDCGCNSKAKYILKKLNTDSRLKPSKAISLNLPFLIKNSGLVLSLREYEDECRIIFEYISDVYNIQKYELIEKLKTMNSKDYMLLQRDVYEFSIELRKIMPLIDKVGGKSIE